MATRWIQASTKLNENPKLAMAPGVFPELCNVEWAPTLVQTTPINHGMYVRDDDMALLYVGAFKGKQFVFQGNPPYIGEQEDRFINQFHHLRWDSYTMHPRCITVDDANQKVNLYSDDEAGLAGGHQVGAWFSRACPRSIDTDAHKWSSDGYDNYCTFRMWGKGLPLGSRTSNTLMCWIYGHRKESLSSVRIVYFDYGHREHDIVHRGEQTPHDHRRKRTGEILKEIFCIKGAAPSPNADGWRTTVLPDPTPTDSQGTSDISPVPSPEVPQNQQGLNLPEPWEDVSLPSPGRTVEIEIHSDCASHGSPGRSMSPPILAARVSKARGKRLTDEDESGDDYDIPPSGRTTMVGKRYRRQGTSSEVVHPERSVRFAGETVATPVQQHQEILE